MSAKTENQDNRVNYFEILILVIIQNIAVSSLNVKVLSPKVLVKEEGVLNSHILLEEGFQGTERTVFVSSSDLINVLYFPVNNQVFFFTFEGSLYYSVIPDPIFGTFRISCSFIFNLGVHNNIFYILVSINY